METPPPLTERKLNNKGRRWLKRHPGQPVPARYDCKPPPIKQTRIVLVKPITPPLLTPAAQCKEKPPCEPA